MLVIIVGRPKLDALENNLAQGVGTRVLLVYMVMENVNMIESMIIGHVQISWRLTGSRMMSKLTRESVLLNQHNIDVTDALRRIQLDTSLSHQGLRAAIDEVIAMVSII